MVGWQRHLQLALRQVGKRLEHCYNASANVSCHNLRAAVVPGELPYLQTPRSSPSLNISRPLYQYLQQLEFSSTRKLFADSSDAAPIPSPLTPVLALPSGSGKSEDQKVVSKPSKVQAVLKGIKQAVSAEQDQTIQVKSADVLLGLMLDWLPGKSPKKVNLVAELVRGMQVEDALLQLQVTIKRASKTVYQVIHSARANATHNHGLNPDRLIVAEAFVGKGYYKKRVSYHAKGKCGIRVRPECRLTVVVREITPEEEAEIAKLKVSNFRKLSKRERRLIPHKLIETTPIWNRKGKARSHGPVGMAT